MRSNLLVLALCFLAFLSHGQDFKVEYDKKADLSGYKTFSFGEGEIITPKDQRQIPDTTLHRWVKEAVIEELVKKGLVLRDSAGDLTVSYIAGSQARSDARHVGPLGMTPGTSEQSYVQDSRQGSLVIDLNDHSDKLVWRVSSVTSMANDDARQMIIRIVVKGFKKFPKKPKEK